MSAEVTPAALSVGAHRLRARRIGIDTQHEAVVVMHKDCSVCRSEGFTAHTRILLRAGERHVIATLYEVTSDLVAPDEAALSESAWARLGLHDGATITVSHADSVESMGHVRSRIHGRPFLDAALQVIELHIRLGSRVAAGEPLCTVYAEAPGELAYAPQYAAANPGIVRIDES